MILQVVTTVNKVVRTSFDIEWVLSFVESAVVTKEVKRKVQEEDDMERLSLTLRNTA